MKGVTTHATELTTFCVEITIMFLQCGVTDMIDLEKSIWGEVTLRGMASSGILNMCSQCPGQAVLLGESFTLPP